MRNDPFGSMLRGFGWTVGRRFASKLPLPLAILAVLLMHFFGRG